MCRRGLAEGGNWGGGGVAKAQRTVFTGREGAWQVSWPPRPAPFSFESALSTTPLVLSTSHPGTPAGNLHPTRRLGCSETSPAASQRRPLPPNLVGGAPIQKAADISRTFARSRADSRVCARRSEWCWACRGTTLRSPAVTATRRRSAAARFRLPGCPPERSPGYATSAGGTCGWCCRRMCPCEGELPSPTASCTSSAAARPNLPACFSPAAGRLYAVWRAPQPPPRP